MRISDWSSDVCSSDLPRTHVLYDVLRLSRSVVVDFKFGDRDRLDFGDERRIAREIAVAERISLAHPAARAANQCNDGRPVGQRLRPGTQRCLGALEGTTAPVQICCICLLTRWGADGD